MGKTSIEWTDYTFNPWIGCQRVSPGCEHCYAEALVKRAPALVLGHGYHTGTPGRLPVWGPLANRRVTSDEYWQHPKQWNRLAEKVGKRRRVFCASMADVFESRNELDVVRTRLWDLIEQTPSLVWMLLTKRPQNILHMVPAKWISDPPSHDPSCFWCYGRGEMPGTGERCPACWSPGEVRWPANAWVGCTVEDQRRADERLPYLEQVPAPVLFVSYEPALEHVDFNLHRTWESLHRRWERDCAVRRLMAGPMAYSREQAESVIDCNIPKSRIGWLIVGGESGPGARPFDLAWARQAVAHCRAMGVPVFVKQLGRQPRGTCDWPFHKAHPPRWVDGDGTFAHGDLCHSLDDRWWPCAPDLRDRKGADILEWPEDLRVREFPR